jgi:GAF domain-containing protein/HAMP domain-containing protein
MLNKLLLVTLGIVIPAILLLSISALLFFQATFIESSGRDLQLIAEGRAGDLHDELSDESSKLQNLASDPFTQSLLNSRAANYAALTDDEIVQQLRAGEQTWQAGEDNNEFVTAILSSARNQHLLEFQRLFPEHQTLILADQHGGTVTATGYVENYGWSRAIWWQIVSQNAFPYIGFAQSSANSVILEIAVPINVDSDPSEIEGVLLSRFDFTDTMVNLYQFEAAESIGLALFEADWVWVAPPRDILRQSDPNLDRVVIASDPAQNWQVMAYNNENSIVAFAPIQRNINQIGTLTWRVVAYEAADVALGPISDARWGALVIGGSLLLLSVLVTLLLARLIVRPLIELSTLAGRIEAGERELDFPETGKDEIGLLATSFRTMVQELNRVVSGLEESVQTRTEDLEKRALQLETSSLVAREAASIRELETLLNSVTELITDRFGFYHTGIFLLDEDGEYAVLRAANSPGGQRMLSRGHKLQVGKVGVVGYAAGVAEPRLAQDVGADVVYYDNPDMPDTRSELALPMKVRDRVIGVLDVQSTRANAFTREDIEILENLTDQIALAIDNARLLESSQRAIEELQYLYGQRAAQAWRQRLTNEPLELYYDASGIRRQPLQVDDVNRIAGPVMYQDIVFRGQVIGTIELERENAQQTWTSEEQALVSEIIEQTALALENARLVDQIRLRSDQIQLLQEVTAISASLKDESEMLGDVAQRLQDGLGLYYVGVMLLDHEQGESRAAATACAPEAPSLNALAETRFPIKGNKVLAEILRTQETTILTNLGENSFAQASYYQHYRNAPTLVIAPLIARNELLGTLELALSDPARRLDDEELNLLEQITAQLSTALDGTRLFSQTASRAERERLVAEITTKVRASNDPGTIIETAVRELRTALNAKHAQIIFDGEGENGDGSVQANGHGDPLVDEDSAEATEQEHSSD